MAEAVARALGGSAAGWRQNQLAEYSLHDKKMPQHHADSPTATIKTKPHPLPQTMTPREQLIQEILLAPDSSVNLLPLMRREGSR